VITNWMSQSMRNIIRNSFSLFILLTFGLAKAQDSLSYLEFLKLVKENHPLALKAQLLKEQAQLIEKQARGGFDPVLSAKMKEKYYGEKYYYTAFNTDLSVHTLAGIDVSVGYTNNNGLYTNPENYTPSGGTGYLGVSVPLGKGLFIDEQRLALRGAEQVKNQLVAESDAQLNDLYFMASQAYWDWYASYYIAANLQKSVVLAQNRFELVKQEANLGEIAGVDTLKAYLQWRDRVVEQLEAERNLVSSSFDVLKWIWKEEVIAKFNNIRPNFNDFNKINIFSQALTVDNNPKITQYEAKIAEQKIEKRYKVEKIKPKLNVDYQLLYNQVLPSFSGFGNNQLWGLSFQYPLFIRNERAGLKMTQNKIMSLNFESNFVKRELNLKSESEIQQLNLTQLQMNQLAALVLDYDKLLSFENTKFMMGESTLFELNAWEMKLLESQNKLAKTQGKYAISQAKILWFSNAWTGLIP
jgi:outer membrane protein TolC